MKLVSVAEAETDLSTLLDVAQRERIVVTRAGKPSVMLIGVESYDDEDWRWAADAGFWQMIRERRRDPRPGIPLAELEARLAARERAERSTRRKKPARKSTSKTRNSKG